MPFARISTQGGFKDIFHVMLSGGGFVVEIYCTGNTRLTNHTKASLVFHF